ncbi:MAG TPA: magnesium-translocating P-type ATPase [Segeticoccus sp.]|nr:magnesium-translocating P-type ATPase [Segeticoccus sp.]HET8601005.1 magnesium-translocating P-type ATPase [Segeticoccus sp.]
MRRAPLVDAEQAFTVGSAASLPSPVVLERLESTLEGLGPTAVEQRRVRFGPNAVRTHRVEPLLLLGRQLRSPLLLLLAATALASFFLGERTNTVVIGVILLASVGLSFVNEYRAALATQRLHAQVTHHVEVTRAGRPESVDVVSLVPGDIVHVARGEVVPADLRLLSVEGLQCDESVLTGESLPVAKTVGPVPAGAALADLDCCALMGTVVHQGAATGIVVATAARTEFGRVAARLGERQPETEFQAGLRRFSALLVKVAATLTGLIFVTNVVLQRPLVDALLFSLAIAVGITPQLLPAVVSTSLAAGSRALARRKVLVKRLVCMEDLGDMDVLVTDKTGTLTGGHLDLVASIDADGRTCPEVLALGRAASGSPPAPGALAEDPLDQAMWDSAIPAPTVATSCLAVLPFDHERQMSSALVRLDDGSTLLAVKGAPEAVLARSTSVPAAAEATALRLFSQGARVVAIATSPGPAHHWALHPDDEHNLTFRGYLVFSDPAKPGVAGSLARLRGLDVDVKVCTGDNAVVAEKLCADLGMPTGTTLTGAQIAAMDDKTLAAAVEATTVFARVTPEQKARVVRALRRTGRGAGFLGDGVNDALALHQADVGISVDSAVDVAKDAADVILLQKDLGVVADGIAEGRRVFTNTIKYVLMGTSSNFGNMFSAAAASAFLAFLPMLPSQILLNNLLYDASQLAIPTDRVDPEQLRRPSHWDIAGVRRFMLFFGPISSLFDFLTFALMLVPFHATPALFRAGWFAESLATQTLIVLAIRTRRPMWRSRPSVPLVAAVAAAVAMGSLLPLSPLASVLGFAHLPLGLYAVLAALVAAYLCLIEAGKRLFFAELDRGAPRRPSANPHHRLQRRASRFSVGHRHDPHTP